MKNERIFIYSETGKKQDFIKSCTATMEQANHLIQTYNSHQDFARIGTLADFEALYSDPLGMFDKTILENIDIKAKGNKQPDPSVLSALFQIDRPGYMAAIGQNVSVKDADCPDCAKRAQTIKVKNIKSNAEFYSYAEFLFFINGSFQLNSNAINEHCDKFSIYAISPEEIALYEHWQGLCDTLNTHNKKYPIGGADVDRIAKALKLRLSQGTSGSFIIDNISLSETIKYMKQ